VHFQLPDDGFSHKPKHVASNKTDKTLPVSESILPFHSSLFPCSFQFPISATSPQFAGSCEHGTALPRVACEETDCKYGG